MVSAREPDWSVIARRHRDIVGQQIRLGHHNAPDFDEVVLRRLVRESPELGVQADWDHQLAGMRAFNPGRIAELEAMLDDARAEARQSLASAARRIAAMIRDRVNDRSVPSRYRREGALWVADMLDPPSARLVPAPDVPEEPSGSHKINEESE